MTVLQRSKPAVPAAFQWGLIPQGPVTISVGGVYSGYWISTDATPAVTVTTTDPVTIRYSVIESLSGATLIHEGIYGCQVTVEHTYFVGGLDENTAGRTMQFTNFQSITVRWCHMQNVRGIELEEYSTTYFDGSTVIIQYNRVDNIKGFESEDQQTFVVGNFIQFRGCQHMAVCELGWNEIVQEQEQSMATDIFSIYNTHDAHIYDNMMWHWSKPGNSFDTSSSGGITIDASQPGLTCDDNVAERNQVVDGLGIITYVNFGGDRNDLLDNRIVADGYLPNGVKTGNGYDFPLVIIAGGSDNHAHSNYVDYVDRSGSRGDPETALAGAQEGGAAEAANNTIIGGPASDTNHQTEIAEWALWESKKTANSIKVGV